jgi:hypothetical protein
MNTNKNVYIRRSFIIAYTLVGVFCFLIGCTIELIVRAAIGLKKFYGECAPQIKEIVDNVKQEW